MGQFLSPVVVDEGVSGLGIRVRGHGGHTAIHIDPERNVVTEKNHRLDVNYVTQGKNVRLSWGLPVLCLKSKNKKNCGKSRAAADWIYQSNKRLSTNSIIITWFVIAASLAQIRNSWGSVSDWGVFWWKISSMAMRSFLFAQKTEELFVKSWFKSFHSHCHNRLICPPTCHEMQWELRLFLDLHHGAKGSPGGPQGIAAHIMSPKEDNSNKNCIHICHMWKNWQQSFCRKIAITVSVVHVMS